jgi:hypothetical protein
MTDSTGMRMMLACVSLIALGAIGGITGDRMLHRKAEFDEPIVVQGDTIRLSDIHNDPVGMLDRAVKLRPDQRERVTAILARRQKDLDQVWVDSRVRLKATVDSMTAEIAAQLDPAQAARFIELANIVHNEPHMLHMRRGK